MGVRRRPSAPPPSAWPLLAALRPARVAGPEPDDRPAPAAPPLAGDGQPRRDGLVGRPVRRADPAPLLPDGRARLRPPCSSPSRITPIAASFMLVAPARGPGRSTAVGSDRLATAGFLVSAAGAAWMARRGHAPRTTRALLPGIVALRGRPRRSPPRRSPSRRSTTCPPAGSAWRRPCPTSAATSAARSAAALLGAVLHAQPHDRARPGPRAALARRPRPGGRGLPVGGAPGGRVPPAGRARRRRGCRGSTPARRPRRAPSTPPPLDAPVAR